MVKADEYEKIAKLTKRC